MYQEWQPDNPPEATPVKLVTRSRSGMCMIPLWDKAPATVTAARGRIEAAAAEVDEANMQANMACTASRARMTRRQRETRQREAQQVLWGKMDAYNALLAALYAREGKTWAKISKLR